MLHRMVKIQALTRVFEPIIGQAPYPGGSISNHQRSSRLAQTPPHSLRMQLVAQGIHAFPGSHKPSFADDGASPSSLTTLVEPKTGAGIDPMPSLRFLASLT